MEIKTFMHLQRVWKAESQIEMQFVKWTTESVVKGFGLVFYDVRHTLVAQDMLVSDRVRIFCIRNKVVSRVNISSLTV